MLKVLITDETREKWKIFAQNNNYSTPSKLVKTAVNFFIDFYQNIEFLKDLSIVSNEFKSPLTSIKGFAQLLIEDYKNELDWPILMKIKQIYDNSLILEEKIKTFLDTTPIEKTEYDILIIEDDTATIMVLEEYFKKRGYKCKGVKSGDTCLEELQDIHPKLILLDILLPDKDGYEVCKEIKLNQELRNIPIFFITAVTEFKVKEKMQETGADGYFLKPFDFSEFEVLFKYLSVLD